MKYYFFYVEGGVETSIPQTGYDSEEDAILAFIEENRTGPTWYFDDAKNTTILIKIDNDKVEFTDILAPQIESLNLICKWLDIIEKAPDKDLPLFLSKIESLSTGNWEKNLIKIALERKLKNA